MVDPTQGFKVDNLYRYPVNALLAHPGLLLLVAAAGLGLAIVAPDICVVAFYQRQCIMDVQVLGIGIAVVSLLPYIFIRYRRDIADRS